MNSNEIFIELREVLIQLYFERVEQIRILDEAGIDKGRIQFSGRAINTWHDILNLVIAAHKLDQLLDLVIKDYGQDNLGFQSAYSHYRNFIQNGGILLHFPEGREIGSAKSLLDQLLVHVESTRWKLSDSNLLSLRKISANIDLLNDLQSFPSIEQRLEFLDAQPATNSKIIEVFSKTRELLVLGEPGAGKSFTLWELTHALVKLAKQDKNSPVPVYLPLASWTPRDSFAVWLARAIGDLYRFGNQLAAVEAWLKDRQLILLLDGLDEVAGEYRAACVQAINQLRQEKGWEKIVISCRTEVYQELVAAQVTLHFSGMIILSPLNANEIEDYLSQIKPRTNVLRDLIRHEATLRSMARTPLMLWVMSNISDEEIEQLRLLNNNDDRKAFLFDIFIAEMFKRYGRDKNSKQNAEVASFSSLNRRGTIQRWFSRITAFLLKSFEDEQPYTELTTKHRLRWLAQRMQETHSSYFFIEKLQPTWLVTQVDRALYIFGSRLLAGFLLAAIIAYGLQVTEFIYYPFIGLIGGGLVGIIDYARLRRLSANPMQQLTVWQQGFFVLVMTVIVSLALTLFFGMVLNDPSSDTFGSFATSGLKLSFIGFFFGLVFGTRGRNSTLAEDIRNIEKLTFSFDKFTQGFVVAGGPFAVFVIFLLWTLAQTGNRGGGTGQWVLKQSQQFFATFGLHLGQPWSAVLFGLVLGIFVGGTVGGAYLVVSPEITDDQRSQTLRIILLNNLWVAFRQSLAFGAIWGLAFFIVFKNANDDILLRSIRSGVTLGLTSFLWYGGYDFIKHYWLRVIFYGRGYLPLRHLYDFLDYCGLLIFLERQQGYKFLHNDLLEHFSNLDLPKQDVAKINRTKLFNAAIYVIALPIIVLLLVSLTYQQFVFQVQAWRLPHATYRQIVVSSENHKDNPIYQPISSVTGRIIPSIQVKKGDRVRVLAGGRLSTGPFVVRVSPNGSEASILGLPIEDFFDRIPEFGNGALMFHIVDETGTPRFVSNNSLEVDCKTYTNQKTKKSETWCLCGSGAEFTSAVTGSLKFEINDTEPVKHRGAFYVTVQVSPP